MCLRNFSKDFTDNNMKKTRLNGYVSNPSVDYNIIDTSKIIDIHKYLINKNDMKWCLELLKNVYYTFK